jgi:hypothetical protein
MVVAAQGCEVAGAGSPAEVVGEGVVEVTLDGGPPASREAARLVSGLDGAPHGGRWPVSVVPMDLLPVPGGVGDAAGDPQGATTRGG